MNIPIERISALATFGYTERESEFLYVVATFSGFFVQRQFASYLGINGRGPVTDLIAKTLQKEHAHEYVRSMVPGKCTTCFHTRYIRQLEKRILETAKSDVMAYSTSPPSEY